MEESSLRGRLLVATPPLVDGNFDRAVVLLLEHGDDGALGVILNRPTESEVADTLEPWAPYAAVPPVLFHGGPVEPGALIGLACMGDNVVTDAWAPVVGQLGTVDLRRIPNEIDPPVTLLRLFLGYAGWGPGQLEGELDVGAWIVADADPDDVFAAAPATLWRNVLGRQPGRLGWLANYPDDVGLN